MGLFGKSKKEKLLEAALLIMNENKPEKDKFLLYYRICQFDLSFNFDDDIDDFLNKYKSKPLYPNQYSEVKNHIKSIMAVGMEISLFIAKRDKMISEKDYNYIWNGITDELKKFNIKFQEILKYYKDLSDNSQPIMPHKLSKDIFNNKLETALYTIRDFAVIVRDTYRFKTEQILEQKLNWAYGST